MREDGVCECVLRKCQGSTVACCRSNAFVVRYESVQVVRSYAAAAVPQPRGGQLALNALRAASALLTTHGAAVAAAAAAAATAPLGAAYRRLCAAVYSALSAVASEGNTWLAPDRWTPVFREESIFISPACFFARGGDGELSCLEGRPVGAFLLQAASGHWKPNANRNKRRQVVQLSLIHI